MSQPPQMPLHLRGAVDLSSLAAPRRPAPPATPAGSAPIEVSDVVIDVTEATFGELVQRSVQVPVVVDLWATWCGPCTQLSPVLESLALEYGGRILLAKIDIDANPQIAQAFQVQSIPMVVAILRGQPLPLFQGALPPAQVRQYLDELLRVAAENGVTDVVTPAGPAQEAEPEEEPTLPPLHQAAYDAIEADDLPGAATAYEQAIAADPGDTDAKAGLAQVRLMQRLAGVDPVAALQAGDAAPASDVEVQLLAADVEIGAGRIGAGFDRVLQVIRATAGPDRDRARQHLLGLFEIVDPTSPELLKARRDLAAALF